MSDEATPRAGERVFVPYRLHVVAALAALLSMAGFAVFGSSALAKPEYLGEFNKKYKASGTRLDSCQTCHNSPQPDKDHLNPYGLDFSKSNHDFGAIEGLDSDGDGFKNIDEINASTFPGDPNDNPNTKAKPKPAPTTTTTRPFPYSLLPKDVPLSGSH